MKYQNMAVLTFVVDFLMMTFLPAFPVIDSCICEGTMDPVLVTSGRGTIPFHEHTQY